MRCFVMRDAVEGQYRKDFTEFLDARRFQMRGATSIRRLLWRQSDDWVVAQLEFNISQRITITMASMIQIMIACIVVMPSVPLFD